MSFKKILPPDLDSKDLWRGDLFNRSQIGGAILNLLKTSNETAVIGIHAPYGYGKTFFLQRLHQLIKQQGGWAIYVNAWEYDYLEDPTLALLDALKEAASETANKAVALESLKKVGAAAAPAIIKGLGKRALEAAIGKESSEGLAESIASATEKSAEKLIKDALEGNTTKKSLKSFRDTVAQFVANNKVKESPFPCLIIIVDELDRAKPSFSISFLETVKHVFSTAEVIFLVGCDRSVLSLSAKHQFGDELDADGYLRRLFDYWIDLPRPDIQKFAMECVRKIGLISDKILSTQGSVWDGAQDYVSGLIKAGGSNLSLRFIEQSVSHASIVFRQRQQQKDSYLIGYLQGLRHSNRELFDAFTSNEHPKSVYRALIDGNALSDSDAFHSAWLVVWATNHQSQLTDPEITGIFAKYPSIQERLRGMVKSFDVSRFMESQSSTAAFAARKLLAFEP